jgi:DNA-binding transcriptional LysR family regulator
MADRLDELNLLAVVLACGSMAGAARALRTSPASVTRTIAALEGRVGTKLLDRTTRRLAPTEAGRELASRGRAIVQSYEAAFLRTADEAAAPEGLIRVSAPRLLGRKHVAPVVHAFMASHQHVRVEMTLSNDVVDLVEQGIDAAVRVGPLRPSTLIARHVGDLLRLLVASPAYLRRRGIPATIHDLRSHDLLLQIHEGVTRSWRFAREIEAAPFAPASRFISNDAHTLIEAAQRGMGIARVLSYQVDDGLRSGALVEVLRGLEPAPVPVHVVYKDAELLPLRVRRFVEFCVPRMREALHGLRISTVPM